MNAIPQQAKHDCAERDAVRADGDIAKVQARLRPCMDRLAQAIKAR